MRIVHEIEGVMQVGGGGEAYAKLKGKRFSPGFRMELVIVTDPNFLQPSTIPREVLHIEGDAAHLLATLKKAIEHIEAMGWVMVEDGLISPEWQSRGEGKPLRPRKSK